MKPMKPRAANGPHAALADLMTQIAASQGEEPAVGVKLAADFEGISIFTFYKMLDPDQQAEFSYTRVARLTAAFRAPAAAEHLAQLAGGMFVPLPEAAPAEADEAGLLKCARESTEALASAWAAKADGVVTPAERADVARHFNDAIAALLEMRARWLMGE